jgi:hypothetical protein
MRRPQGVKKTARNSSINQGDFAACGNTSRFARYSYEVQPRAVIVGQVTNTRRIEMKKFAKIALGALLLTGAATAMAAAPADARVVVGVGVGPGYYGPGPAPYPYYGCGYYSPYACGYPGYYGYYGPSFGIGIGGWGHGGYRGGFHGGGHHR